MQFEANLPGLRLESAVSEITKRTRTGEGWPQRLTIRSQSCTSGIRESEPIRESRGILQDELWQVAGLPGVLQFEANLPGLRFESAVSEITKRTRTGAGWPRRLTIRSQSCTSGIRKSEPIRESRGILQDEAIWVGKATSRPWHHCTTRFRRYGLGGEVND